MYVLEASLQDGKKIPKWNHRDRMVQFFWFLGEHLSTVALMWNLHTGHVSPQYHVVFNDKFETVFSDGKTLEEVYKICNELFVNIWDCYMSKRRTTEMGCRLTNHHLLSKCGFLNQNGKTVKNNWRSSVLVLLANVLLRLERS